ncbi:MAG TPA: NYN domain-containing protein [Candidatus Limnocylindrales bacterium]|nr:NYN domain-containing protein [Candidatus Limnocylindrales bacterium]
MQNKSRASEPSKPSTQDQPTKQSQSNGRGRSRASTGPSVQDQKRPQTAYAFIDSQNLNVGVQKFGWKMDWQKFRKFLAEKYGVTKAYMFIGYVPEFEAMYEQLHDAGYLIVLKPTYDMSRPQPEQNAEAKEDGVPEEKKQVKGNIDADLVLWAMKEISNYDRAVLVSGDGDFYSLVEYLESKKRLHKILTPSFQYSQLYNKYEAYIERLDQHKKELRYYDRKRK